MPCRIHQQFELDEFHGQVAARHALKEHRLGQPHQLYRRQFQNLEILRARLTAKIYNLNPYRKEFRKLRTYRWAQLSHESCYQGIKQMQTFAIWCSTSILSRIVAPSFVVVTSPSGLTRILSIPLGPNDDLRVELTAFAARI